MRARVILTHHHGVNLQGNRAHPLGELSGQLITHMLTIERLSLGHQAQYVLQGWVVVIG